MTSEKKNEILRAFVFGHDIETIADLEEVSVETVKEIVDSNNDTIKELKEYYGY